MNNCTYVFKKIPRFGERCTKPSVNKLKPGYCTGHRYRKLKGLDMDGLWRGESWDYNPCTYVYKTGSRKDTNCDREARNLIKPGYCRGHQKRKERGLNMEVPWPEEMGDYNPCIHIYKSGEQCMNTCRNKYKPGYCASHGSRKRKGLDMDTEWFQIPKSWAKNG